MYFPVEHNTATNLAEKTLMVLQALCDTGQAFVNFMLFCVFNTDVRAHFSRKSERRIMEVVEEEEDGENEERVGMLQK
ncbi:hypothetical protein DPMN_161366 [Dreissena polymorpha]|uniref:Uncharacterized protein n=1 Tax=Dreissena polymorpha TaxID=45954 RepID=A0A9D4EPK6_DREPO|nr:hypothetical protein DPMN_161366 [Dreissena polymorpha]